MIYRAAFRVLQKLDPESIHHLVFRGLQGFGRMAPLRAGLGSLLRPHDPALRVVAFGHTFAGPLGLAAGFDKNAQAIDALSSLGFSFVEAGTVTARAQQGNPKPRLFRLIRDRAILNRMGFNNDGAEAVERRLVARPPASRFAINIGKSKATPEDAAEEDYAKSARLLAGVAPLFCVINVSSPNTVGLRALQAVDKLRPITRAVGAALREGSAQRIPLLVKIAPDLTEFETDAIVDLALEEKLDGIVATNTTLSREGLRTPDFDALGAGGISGEPLRARALSMTRRVFERSRGDLTIIGAGGIASAEDAWSRIGAGATLLELYTAFIYEGPLVAKRIHDGLRDRLKRHGMRSLAEAIGRDVP